MTDDYIPKPWHFLFPVLLFAAGSLLLIDMFWMSIGLWLLGTLAATWIFIAGLWKSRADYNYSIVAVAHEIKEMNPEQWQALGIRFPELRIRYHGKPISYIEDTDIRSEWMKQFLDDSDEYQFAPERLYGEGTQARKQWMLVRDFLISEGYLIDQSAAGNHSWLWRTGRRRQLLTMYFDQPLVLQNLNEEPTNV